MSIRAGRRGVFALLAATLALAAGCGGDDGFGVGEAGGDEPDHAYVIPAGTAAALEAGESPDLLPGRLEVEVGEVIEIVNDDDVGQLVGPFYVGAGETLRQRFSSPGEYRGECAVHPSGEITIVVR